VTGITTARSTSSSAPLDEVARDFWWNGFVVLKGLTPTRLVDEVRGEIDTVFDDDVNGRVGRVQDTWEIQRGTREVATAQRLLETLRFFYGRRPIPYQTLSFQYGSQQKPHTDCWHASTMPTGFVCSAWTGIDATDAENGPLYCYPGSHHLAEMTPQHLAPTLENFDYRAYEVHQETLMQILGYERHEFHTDPGDVIVFAGNLVHGGAPIVDPDRKRRAIVTQFVFERCVYYTPRRSDVAGNEVALRDSLVDITTGRRIKHSYDGRGVAYYRLENMRSRVYLDPTLRQRATAFLNEARGRFPHRRARRRRAEERLLRQELGQTLWRQRDRSGRPAPGQPEPPR
jgi:ectoine hydroxylase-related dioxygenase (phytanoyl-CoA dioxygenase family)